jgi:hypothetical protein
LIGNPDDPTATMTTPATMRPTKLANALRKLADPQVESGFGNLR